VTTPTAAAGTTLVTGGAGFIGANLVRRLLASGHQVRVLDLLVTGDRDYLAGLDVDFVEGDIRDRDVVAGALQGIDQVVHLAASGSVIASIEDPAANFSTNVDGTFAVLDETRKAGIERLVFSSTGGALMGNTPPPVNEQSVPKPISPYGASKSVGEAYLHAYAVSYGMKTVATRFANVYGPYSGHKMGAITVFFKALHTGEPIVIYGSGSDSSRDYLYVDDLCAGIEAGLRADVPGGSVYHLATGIGTTVKELADACCRVAGKPDHPIEYRPYRRGEVERNFATYDLAKAELGFEPSVALEDGLARTWDWYLAHVL
jgi:UDP-glucose 4-epimerase